MKLFCVSTLTVNYQKEKLIKQSHLQLYKKKIPGNKYNQGGKRSVLGNYKTFMKEVEDGINGKTDHPCGLVLILLK